MDVPMVYIVSDLIQAVFFEKKAVVALQVALRAGGFGHHVERLQSLFFVCVHPQRILPFESKYSFQGDRIIIIVIQKIQDRPLSVNWTLVQY